eukprot:CAMPEP_0174853642 /NCGR_PEP_ID=MMETSP1114-20130205/29258_1 /TAXON_ID=312471 /ORGANISM="Neobodo designis, Strain CCAP 1951/1" /LENGTH=100 /DNA_ID=CAMNT_0016088299 /DNA_START=77 /DNA_END=380 /DNA_ORIENTATION=+
MVALRTIAAAVAWLAELAGFHGLATMLAPAKKRDAESVECADGDDGREKPCRRVRTARKPLSGAVRGLFMPHAARRLTKRTSRQREPIFDLPRNCTAAWV